MVVSFDNPWYLLLIPVVIVFLIITQKFMFTREKGVKIGQLAVRLLLFLALIFALAGLNIKITGKNSATVYVLDISDSVRNKKDEVIEFVNDSIENKKKNDTIGIVAFGADNKIEQILSENPIFSQFQTEVDTSSTNLEEAVKIALSQIPEETAGRIVLISDGNENEGSLKNVAADVISSGYVFEIKKIEEEITDEVYVSDLTVPQDVGIGENFNIEVEVESNVSTNATVKLYAGRTLKAQEQVYLQKGTNTYIFKDTQSDEGLKTYKVVVEADDDTISVNNEFSAYTDIKTVLPLLIVEGKEDNSINYRKIMDAIGIKYNVVSPSTVPNNIPDLMEYSAVVFVDVFLSDLRDGFTDVIGDYVKNNGGGFVITGGPNSYALGGYRGTVIEDVSPVYMDLRGENEIPSMAMCMVIDHSGSMSSGNGVIDNLSLAKSAASAAIDYLRPEDQVEVIAFDDSFSRVVPFTHVDKPGDIQQKISTISTEGGTNIYPALEAAVRDINETDAMIKHIILLTDGQDSNDEYDELLQIINDAGITLSTVAVGQGCNDYLLERLAREGGGRMFYTDLDSDLPRIFAQEVFLASNEYLVNETFTPKIASNDAIIREVASNGLPDLHGYVATTPKEQSIELVESFQNDPILAYWHYGLGKTVAWTSDVTGEWSSEYSDWDGTAQMWNNIIKFVTDDNGIEGTYAEVEQNGNKATIKYNTNKYSSDTKVEVNVYDENGDAKTIEMDPKKPGQYEAEFDTKSTGIYTINVQQKEKDEVYSSINTAAIMQYSLEYRFYPDNTLLEDFAASVGGMFIDKASEVFEHKPEYVRARFSLWILLLIVSMIVFLIDIAVRRFHLSLAFIDRNAAKRAKKKALKEEMKRKEEAEQIKMDTVSEPVVEKKVSDKVQTTNTSAKKSAAKTKQQSSSAAKSTQSVNSAVSSYKKAQEAAKKPQEKTFDRTFERTTPAPKAPEQNKDVNKPGSFEYKKPKTENQGIKDAQLKTRVWVRDSNKK